MPIGFFSEDASEIEHKYFKENELQHARQNSRAHRLSNLFMRSTYMTDPELSFIFTDERSKQSKKLGITEEMNNIYLLIE